MAVTLGLPVMVTLFVRNVMRAILQNGTFKRRKFHRNVVVHKKTDDAVLILPTAASLKVKDKRWSKRVRRSLRNRVDA